jgi:adenylate cyclase
VNLASRVQGATKYLRSNLLVTQHTRSRLEECPDFRRLCKIRVINIDEPVELFDLPVTADASWHSLKASYESALEAFEAHEYRIAMRRILDCLEIAPEDGPSTLLLSRSVTAMGEGLHDDAWILPGK